MPAFQSTFEDLTQSWQLRLQEAEAGETDLLAWVETCIRICEESLLQLKQWVQQSSFPCRDCEIYFFKQVKPVVMARYICYQKIYRLHIGYFNSNGLLAKERLEMNCMISHVILPITRIFIHTTIKGQLIMMTCILYGVNMIGGFVPRSPGDGKLAELMAYELLMKYVDGMLNIAAIDGNVLVPVLNETGSQMAYLLPADTPGIARGAHFCKAIPRQYHCYKDAKDAICVSSSSLPGMDFQVSPFTRRVTLIAC
jgi:hypothetical protein